MKSSTFSRLVLLRWRQRYFSTQVFTAMTGIQGTDIRDLIQTYTLRSDVVDFVLTKMFPRDHPDTLYVGMDFTQCLTNANNPWKVYTQMLFLHRSFMQFYSASSQSGSPSLPSTETDISLVRYLNDLTRKTPIQRYRISPPWNGTGTGS